MPTVGVGNDGLTFADIMKRLNPDGSLATTMIELMTQENGLLKDAIWKQGNLNTGHRVNRRDSVPTPEFRVINAGTSRAKSTSHQVDESVGLMETWSVVDVRLAKLGGNPAAVRASEDMAFRQGFNNLFETTMWYGNTETDPEKWMGMAPRFDLTTAQFGGQIVLPGIATGGSDQNSFYFIDWGLDSVYCIYAAGQDGGLHIEDMGIRPAADPEGKEYRAYYTAFDWECGLAVANPTHVVRVPNIDSSAVSAASSLIIQGLTKGYHQLKRGGKTVGYCNPFVGAYLHLQAQYVAINGTLSVSDPAGMPVVSIFGIPIRLTQGLTSSEAIVA
jgi:hypothetical protein